MRSSPTLLGTPATKTCRWGPLFAAALCALAVSAASAQNAGTLARTPTNNLPSNVHFSYDAQHDSVTASGMQIKPSVQSNAVTPTSGSVTVTLNISVVSHFPRGTQFHCSLTLIGGILDLNNAAVVGGIETANGTGSWSGPGTATCTLTIPYSWTIPPDPAAQSGLIMAFGVAAVSEHEGGAVVHRSSLQLDGIENLPPNGTNQSFSFGVTL